MNKLQELTAALIPKCAEPLRTQMAASVAQRPPIELPEPVTGFSLLDCWRVIHGRRWTVLMTVAVAMAGAVLYNYVAVPTYRAVATLQIDREQRNIAQLDEQLAQLAENPDYIETQYKILKSRTLARRVIGKLGLENSSELRRGIASGEQGASAKFGPHPEFLHPAIVDNFLERLAVQPGKGTRLLDVSFESVHRELAPRVVNVLAEEYIEHNLEAKWIATQKASKWLEQQLSQLQARLKTSENELNAFGARNAIIFIEERKDITTGKLAQLEDELTRSQAERISKQSQAMLVEDAVRQGRELPRTLESKLYEDLQKSLVELRREHAQLLVTFAPGYPKVQRVQQEIGELEQSLQSEQTRLLQATRESYQVAKQREELLQRAALEQRGVVNRLSDEFVQYDVLKREAESNRQLYEGLLQRLKEAGVSAGLRASNIAVLDSAETPERSYRPKKLLNFALAAFFGLSLGFVLAFVQEHMDTTIRTPEEVEHLTGLYLLSVIPCSRSDAFMAKFRVRPSNRTVSLLRGRPPTSITSGLTRLPVQAAREPDPALGQARADGAARTSGPALAGARDFAGNAAAGLVSWRPEGALSEAYRTLRSSVLLGIDESMRRLLITSSQPQEGKTTVSLNLACSLAQLGRRVLVIDADMRRPKCARELGVKPDIGLSEYLQGRAELDEILIPTPVADLSLVPGGRSNLTAPDLLYSPRLAALLEYAGRRYDHVIVDSPPSLVLCDARTISSLVDGVILVVSDQTERNALLRTKQMFDDGGARYVGFVMNRVNLDELNYGYYRDYGYNYTYAEKRDD